MSLENSEAQEDPPGSGFLLRLRIVPTVIATSRAAIVVTSYSLENISVPCHKNNAQFSSIFNGIRLFY